MMRKQQKFLPDEFFTDEKEAKRLIAEFQHREGFRKFDLIVEPSAGNGSFYKNLPRKEGRRIIGVDITPRVPGVIKHNFLTWKHPTRNDKSTTLCIGNPPFGRNSKIASEFVDRCSQFSDHIAMILPLSYKHIPDGFEEQWSIKLSPSIFVHPDGSEIEQKLFTKFVYYKFTDKIKSIKKKHVPNGMWERLPIADRYDADFRIIKAGQAGNVYSVKSDYFEPPGIWHANNFYIRVHRKYKSKLPDILDTLSKHKWPFINTTNIHSISFEMFTVYMNKLLPVL